MSVHHWWRGRVPYPRSGGGTPSQVWVGGYPIPGLDGGGVPHPRSGRGGRVSQPGLDGGGAPGVPPGPGLDGEGYPP